MAADHRRRAAAGRGAREPQHVPAGRTATGGGTVSPLTGVPSRRAAPVTVEAVFSRLLTPKWVLLHLVVAALFVATFFLGYWQLSKAEAGGGAVNWSYALQWPLYGFMGLGFYVKMCLDEIRRDPDEDEPGAEDRKSVV